ncbi:MFS transporter, partial [bacterium]|nr:MFS transporter [bacterium]
TNRADRGRELSLLESTSTLLAAVMPLIAGWIIWQYSYEVLFLIAIIIFLISLLPLLYLPRTEERFSWGYFQTWKEFFSKKRRRTVLAFMNDGAENSFTIIIWPIFIFKLLEGNYFEAGLITSLVVFLTVILQLIVGKNLDLKDKKNILKHGTWFYSVGWIIKIFISSAFHIFIVSTYHSLSRIFTRTPFDSLIYEKAADQGHFVDEFTVIHEMAIGMGRIVILTLVLVLLPYIGLNWTFVFAALTTLGMNFMTEDRVIKEGRHAG